MGGLKAGLAGVVTAAVAAALALGAVAPAHADDTVTVHGTDFPDPVRAQLSYVGCGDLYSRSDEPLRPAIGRGPGAAPLGERSLGFDLRGGNAIGALYTVSSVVSTTTASLAVNAAGRATGVAYAGYRAPGDEGTPLLWIGRSELVTPGGAWQTVDVTDQGYDWTQYDTTTGQALTTWPGTTTVRDFAAAHGGDGPGVYSIGFGCDGTPFSLDALRVGTSDDVTTYDVEGLRTSVTIAALPERGVRPGDRVEIRGQLESGSATPVPHATMILEQRRPGSERWTPVTVADVGADGRVSAAVRPEGDAVYRWRFVDRPLAEGSASTPLAISVLPVLPTEPPTPTPSDDPSEDPTGSPSDHPDEPSDPPSSQPTDDPSSWSSPSSDGSPSGGGSLSAETSESSSVDASPSGGGSTGPTPTTAAD
jgi:hypothetical protein